MGVQPWTTLPGQMCSSTRAEIAAVIGALTDTEAIRIGIDNQGAMSNVNRLISTAANYLKKINESANWKPPRYPLGKAWGGLSRTETCLKLLGKRSKVEARIHNDLNKSKATPPFKMSKKEGLPRKTGSATTKLTRVPHLVYIWPHRAR